ncbi:MAG TPA: efflux RND transporter periplasmic adaptor subunit [Gemmatimonadaceae bacterium]|nr:efflux RND transporter periplasmic adaptor subunit [Gemmatimonadaceae bacterium]
MTSLPARSAAPIIVALCVAGACSKPAKPFAPPPAQVGIVTVAPASIPEAYEFVGQVSPFRRVEVRSRVEGIVTERPFTEGTYVQKGQILYKLDVVKYDAAYRSAVARLDNAKRTLARLEPLVPQHAVAQQDVDNARSELESAQAAVDVAKKDLDDTVIRAEISGQVGRAGLELGARVTGPADLLATIDELDPIYVTFHPSSQQLLAWQSDPQSRALLATGAMSVSNGTGSTNGIGVRVVLPNGSLLPRVGHINFMSPSLDSASGTQEFRAEFTNGDRRLLPGQFVRVRLEGFARSSALAVPQRAVQQGLGRQFVYVVGAGDTVVARDVNTGQWSGNLWLIDSGLVAGDRVVVDGIQKVAPGRVVRPLPIDSTVAKKVKS